MLVFILDVGIFIFMFVVVVVVVVVVVFVVVVVVVVVVVYPLHSSPIALIRSCHSVPRAMLHGTRRIAHQATC